jgi:hypothetical protein
LEESSKKWEWDINTGEEGIISTAKSLCGDRETVQGTCKLNGEPELLAVAKSRVFTNCAEVNAKTKMQGTGQNQ